MDVGASRRSVGYGFRVDQLCGVRGGDSVDFGFSVGQVIGDCGGPSVSCGFRVDQLFGVLGDLRRLRPSAPTRCSAGAAVPPSTTAFATACPAVTPSIAGSASTS